MKDVKSIIKQIGCEREDCRVSYSIDCQTLVAYIPVYNKQGENINPDRNDKSGLLNCRTCNRYFNFDYSGLADSIDLVEIFHTPDK